jgi:hypothetical protein
MEILRAVLAATNQSLEAAAQTPDYNGHLLLHYAVR